MSSLAEILAQAQAHRKAGRLRDAERLYRQVLESDPDNEAHHGLGQVLAQQERLDEAIASFQQAARLNPASGEISNNLRGAIAARETGRGMALAERGQLDQALACYRRALDAQPNYAAAYGNLGNVLATQGKLDEAAACFRRAVELQPGLAQAHYALAVIAEQQSHWNEAIAQYRRTVELNPDLAEVQQNFGILLAKQNRGDEAALCFRRVLELKPDLAEAHHRLGGVLASQDRLDEAAACFRRAGELEPDHAEALHNLGVVLARGGKLEEALEVQRRTIALQPDHAQAHMARGGTLLILGKLSEGWQEYEWRHRIKDCPPPPSQWTLWNGEPLAGRTLVLCSEQGLGDTLQFVRYAPLVQQQGARVIVSCGAGLHPILARTPGVDAWITPRDESPAADFYVQFLSVPHRLQTTLATIPASIPYIFAEPKRVEMWRQKLAACEGFKVGIVWHGSGRGRSIPLACFAPLAKVAGVRLVNLEKGPGCEQLPAFTRSSPIVDFGDDVDASGGSFMDTAAIMMNLDLVITADTAAAHLAGALGVKVWVALARVPEWRWMLERQDSPWYPTMRLFRQTRPDDWATVFQSVQEELAEAVKEKKGRRMKDELGPNNR